MKQEFLLAKDDFFSSFNESLANHCWTIVLRCVPVAFNEQKHGKKSKWAPPKGVDYRRLWLDDHLFVIFNACQAIWVPHQILLLVIEEKNVATPYARVIVFDSTKKNIDPFYTAQDLCLIVD